MRATIYSPTDPRERPPRGAVWLDGDHLEDRCWQHICELLAWTGPLTRSWMGVWWESREGMSDRPSTAEGNLFPREQRGVISCELERDNGYDGVSVRLDVAPEVAALARQTAVALGGGAS